MVMVPFVVTAVIGWTVWRTSRRRPAETLPE
jgi:hypothetical protein